MTVDTDKRVAFYPRTYKINEKRICRTYYCGTFDNGHVFCIYSHYCIYVTSLARANLIILISFKSDSEQGNAIFNLCRS